MSLYSVGALEKIETATDFNENLVEVLPETRNNAITYSNIFENASLEYEVSSSMIKESIVVDSKSDNYIYEFSIDFGSYVPIETSDGGIDIYETAESVDPIMAILPPYMFDADGETSYEVTLDLVENASDYTLIVEADADWINAFGRDFPVTIDPTVDLDVGRNNVHDTHVNQNLPNMNYDSDYQIEVGKNGNNLYRTYIKYDLPSLPDCSIVTGAELTLIQNWARSIDSTDLYLNVYQCNTDWNETTLTWNNQPIQNLSTATVIDYTGFQNGMSAEYSLTITKIVKDWYENGDNYGLMLALSDETVVEKTSFYSSNNLISNYPVVTVSYINNTGIEDYWNYETFAVGDRGAAYINTYNGAMTYIHSDVTTNGLIAPAAISHVYTNGERNVSGVFNNMSFGKGFKLNIFEKIEASDSVLAEHGYPYRYIDADGTVHYFKNTGTANRYCYEYDENIILTKSSSGYTLTNPSGTSKLFNGDGYLTKTVDANGNNVELYHTDRIYSVFDGADQQLRLSYNLNNNRLNDITDTAGRKVSYTYDSSGFLTRITYPDGTYTQYQYNSSTSMLTKIINPDNSSISFGYKAVVTPGKTFYRVTSVSVADKNGASYDTISFEYRTSDTFISNTKGDTVVIAFDNMGRAVNAVKNGKTISAASYCGISDGSNKTNNLKASSNSFVHNYNYKSDHVSFKHFETTAESNFGITCTTSSTERIFNQWKSTKLSISNDIDSETLCFYTYVLPNTSGETFTASMYVNIVDTLSAGSAYMKFVAFDEEDNRLFEVKGDEITTTGNAWQRLSLTVNIPEDVDVFNLVVVCGIFNGNGTMYCEDVYYQDGDAAGRYNFVQNSSFESLELSDRFNQWCIGASARVATNPVDGSRAAKVIGTTDPLYEGRCTAYQFISMNGKAGDVLVAGASAKALCSASGNQGNRFFGMRITLSNGSNIKQVEIIEFDENVYDTFQTVMSTFVAENDYNQIFLELCYEYEINEAIFDDAFIFREPYGTYYEYDEDGKLISARDDNGNEVAYTYSGSDLATVTSTSNDHVTQTTSYTYNSTHNLTSSVGSNGVRTSYTYPSSGNKGLPLSVTVTDSSGSLSSTTSYTYTEDYNHLLSVTDPSGAVTQYQYDYGGPINKGLVTQITDPNGNVTYYDYDANNDLPVSVSATDTNDRIETNLYYNSSNQLDYVLFNEEDEYYIGYDSLGRQDYVSTTIYNLTSNTYDNKGNLSSVTYGNGGSVSFGYDADGQLVSEAHDGALAYKYHYSDEGWLGSIDDLENNVSWDYYYDFAGRLTDTVASDGRLVEYEYNDKNQVSRFAVSQSGTDMLDVTYGYDSSGRATQAQVNSMPGAPTQNYTLDGLGRLTKFTSTYSGSNTVSQNYTYLANGTNQTGRVNTISYLKNDSTALLPQLKYTYDAKGNITHVYENNVLKLRYAYDGLNRLVREDNAYDNMTTVYYYEGSNIICKEWYDLSFTSALGRLWKTIDYEMMPIGVPNAMTSYDGSSISYDTIGNPTSYRGYSMVWENGRQLASMSKSGMQLQFKYDFNGMRTSKTVNGVKTEYFYVGDKLISQKTGDEVINFAYTNSGAPYGFTYNGASYFYLLNIQGDVIGIYDSTGTVVVEYSYDAWGRMGPGGGSLASTIGVKNPIRYRGYYYDTETGLYYLQSRYYDPETCRFINADSLIIAGDYLQGTNMFAYCLNNPVMYVDPTGSANEELAADIVIVIACLGYIADYAEKNNLDIAAFEDYYNRRLKNASSLNEVKEHLMLGIDIMTGAASGLQSAYSNVGTLADVFKIMGKNIPDSLGVVLSGMEVPFQIWLDFNNPLVFNTDIVVDVIEIFADFYSSTMISSAAAAVATAAATANPILGVAMGVAVLWVGDALWEEIKSPGNI